MNSVFQRYLLDNIKEIFIVLICGVMTPLGYAPFGFYPVPFLTIGILIYLCIGRDYKFAALFGFVFGLGFFGFGVNWLHISINLFGGINIIGAVFITALLVAYMSIYPALFGMFLAWLTVDKKVSALCLFVVPAIWILGEWIRSWLFTGFPWLNLGYSQIDSALSGLAPIIGVFGIGYCIVFTSTVMIFLYFNRTRGMYLTLVIIIWMLAWTADNNTWSDKLNKAITVALVQGAIPQEIKWLPEMRQPTKDLYLGLTKSQLQSELIIWPEAAIPAYYHQELPFIQSLQDETRNYDSQLLTGIPVYESSTGNYFNSAVLLNSERQFYFKKHLVPFGEYLPLKFLLNPVVDTFDIPISEFTPGNQSRPLLTTDNFVIGITICYEDTFGIETIRALPEANILVNISNDAWFGDSLAPHQHLEMARMRAKEAGRYLLRATNTGITAIINEKGNILSLSPQFEKSVLTGSAELYQGHTPYSRFGDSPFIIFCILVLTGFCGFKIINRNRQEIQD